MISFLMHKLPSETHLHCFGDYLQQIATKTMPKIELTHAFPKTQAGFNNTVKTEVVAIKPDKDHASATDLILTWLFPASPTGEMYVSFIQGMEETMLKQLHKQQNQWLAEVKMITIRGFNNIDWKYDIGLSTKYSLWEFMINQPGHPTKVPIDVENGGEGGKT
jgi:hypothetical protein